MASRPEFETTVTVVAQNVSSSHDALARVYSEGDVIQASMCPRAIHGEAEIVVKCSHREEGDYLGVGAIQYDVRTMVEAQLLLEELAASTNVAGIQIDMVEPAQSSTSARVLLRAIRQRTSQVGWGLPDLALPEHFVDMIVFYYRSSLYLPFSTRWLIEYYHMIH